MLRMEEHDDEDDDDDDDDDNDNDDDDDWTLVARPRTLWCFFLNVASTACLLACFERWLT